mgnify:FL=1
MLGDDAEAQPRLAARHGGIDRRWREHAALQKRHRESEGVLVSPDEDRQYRRFARKTGVEMTLFRLLTEAADVPVQAFHDGGIVLQEADGFERRRGERGRNAHGEHEPRQVVAQILDERAAARKVSAAGAETLGERAHFHVDIVPGKTEVFVHAAAGPAEHARRVRLVDHQEAAVLLLDAHELRHGGNVAVHAVHALGDDEHLGVLIAAGAENGLERGGVVVREGAALGVGEARALVDGIVRERVIDDEIALAAEVADDRHIRGMPADENNGVLGMLPRGDGIFQLFVDGLLAEALHP